MILKNCSSEKNFGFTKEQVRVVLFRECDFRGRKLLFDSTAIKKLQINHSMEAGDSTSYKKESFGSFAEVSNGFGYMVRTQKLKFFATTILRKKNHYYSIFRFFRCHLIEFFCGAYKHKLHMSIIRILNGQLGYYCI